ncbi:MAG: hypothetical protein WCD57_03975, partial [Acidobacteriaceae bacterium]
MPKNKVSDLITDQEMAFALLVLSGTLNDRDAAEAAGLNPDTAAYTKAKPRVRAYMLEHRAAMQQQLLDQESERLRRQEQRREQVLDRLWEIAKLSPEITRGSITGQVKAIAMIVAIESLIPDRRAASSEKKSTPPLPHAEIYPAACPTRPAVGLGRQQEKTIDPEPDPALAQEEDDSGLAEPETTPNSAQDAPPPPGTPPNPIPSPIFDRSESAFANRFGPSQTTSWAPDAFDSAPGTRAPFSLNPF